VTIDLIYPHDTLAALNAALHQSANRLMHLRVRGFEHLLGITEQCIERGRDELLRSDGINE
jgi:hypothetical protein